MNVYDFLLPKTPENRLAIIDSGDVPYSYGQLRHAVDRLATHVAMTTRLQDRVLLLAENSFFWICAYLAAIKAGRVIVPLPHHPPEQAVRRVIANCTPALAFLDQAHLSMASHVQECHIPVITDTTTIQAGVVSLLEAADHHPMERSIDFAEPARALASLMYTSGSTGDPRGVMVSHTNIAANTASIVHYLGLTSEDRMMEVLPLSYCFGASLLHTHLRIGASLVLDNQFRHTDAMLDRMDGFACTGFAGVPAIYQILLAKSSFARRQFPHLRYLQQAGGKLPRVTLEQLIQILGDKKLYVMYGQTEATARLSYLPPELLLVKPGSIGRGIPDVVLQVLDEEDLPVRPGEIGELVAQGPNITLGYWGDPEQTRKVFREGQLHTGDLGTVDEEGFIYVTGRGRDFLKLAGVRICAEQLEEIVGLFPDIDELAFVARQDETCGEVAVLFVVHPCGEEVREELQVFCSLHLVHSQRPAAIYFRERLPRTSSGKIDRGALRKEAAALLSEPSKKTTASLPQVA
jgi:long-chain acyl-CoA synthetase